MRTATAAEIEAHLDAYLDDLTEEPIVITRDGRPAAVLVPPGDDDDLERLLLAYNPRFRRILEDAHERIQRGEGMSEEEFWKAVDERYGADDAHTSDPI